MHKASVRAILVCQFNIRLLFYRQSQKNAMRKREYHLGMPHSGVPLTSKSFLAVL